MSHLKRIVIVRKYIYYQMISRESYQNLIIEKYVYKIIILTFHYYSIDVSVVAIFVHEFLIYCILIWLIWYYLISNTFLLITRTNLYICAKNNKNHKLKTQFQVENCFHFTILVVHTCMFIHVFNMFYHFLNI